MNGGVETALVIGAFEAVRAEAAGAPPRFTSELSRGLAL